MVPNTSRCVDSDSAIDSLIAVDQIVKWSQFRSSYDDGFVKYHDIDTKTIRYDSGSIIIEFYANNYVDRDLQT